LKTKVSLKLNIKKLLQQLNTEKHTRNNLEDENSVISYLTRASLMKWMVNPVGWVAVSEFCKRYVPEYTLLKKRF
jgi:mannosyltransferase OCH1-like enzyme